MCQQGGMVPLCDKHWDSLKVFCYTTKEGAILCQILKILQLHWVKLEINYPVILAGKKDKDLK